MTSPEVVPNGPNGVTLPILPSRWQWARLDQLLLRIEAGKSFRCEERPPIDGEYGVVKVSAVTWGTYDEQESKTITDADRIDEAYLIRPGDFLFSRANTIQLVGASVIVHATSKRLLLSDKILRFVFAADFRKWINWLFKSSIGRSQIEALSTGNQQSMRNIGQQRIGQICVPVAPPKEMNRIISKIDELFSRIEEGERALERVQKLVERYRQSVLKAAVTGELTRDWREKNKGNRESGEALLARLLKARREAWERAELDKMKAKGMTPADDRWKQKYEAPLPPNFDHLQDLPAAWTWVSVEQAGEARLGRQRAPQHHMGDHMRPYLRVANVHEDRLDLSDVMRMNFTPEEFKTYELRSGDVLLNEGQSPELVGRPAMYRGEIPGCCYQKTLLRFRAYDGVHSEFALFVFRSYLHSGRFRRSANITTSIAHLAAERFVKIEFPLPPKEEQAEIVEIASRKLTALAHLERDLTARCRAVEGLRQSVLKSAFSGQIALRDPTDESASRLLDRIASERGTAPVKPNRGPKNKTKESA